MAALLAIAAAGAWAQSQATGALAGTLTDLHATPLEGATVVVRNEATGAVWRTTTGKKGSYRFAGLEAGEYTLEAESERLGRGQLGGIVVAAGHEAHVLAAMRFEPATAMPVQTAAHPADTGTAALRPTDKSLSAAAPVPAPVDKQASAVTPALQPADKTLSAATPVPAPADKQASAVTPALQPADKTLSAAAPVPAPVDKQASAVTPALQPADKTQSAEAPVPAPADKQASAAAPALQPADKTLSAATPVPAPADKQASALTPVPRPVDKKLSTVNPSQLSADKELPAVAPGPHPADRNVSELTLALHPADKGLSTEILVATGALHAEPLLRLPLPQQSWAGGRGLAMSEAAGALMQAALEFSSARPVQAAIEDAETPAATTTVTAAQLQALPLSGRRWQDFVLDTSTAGTGAGGEPSLRGGEQASTKTTIDGARTRLAFEGAGGISQETSGPESSGRGEGGQGVAEQNGMGRVWTGGQGSQVAEAAIRQVETAAGNAEAEGARAAGGQMNIETQRGANGLHGQGFLFDRENTWGAQNPFTQWEKETAPATLETTPVFTGQPYTPPDHETTWGIGLGSQIRRDKLFWFGAVDSYQRNDPGLAMVKIPQEFFAQPSNDQMQVLAAQLGLNSSNPVAEGLAAYSKMLETLDGLLGPAPRTAAQWVGFSRIDWQVAERHRVTLEGIGANWNSPGGGLTRVSETYGSNSFGSSQANQEWLLGRWEAFLTPNLLAVTQASVGRTIQSAHAETPSAFEQTFLSPSIGGQLPQMVVDSRYGFTIGNPSRFGQGSYPDEKVYEEQERLEWVKGSLQIRGGFDLSHNFDATGLLRNGSGTYSYSTAENFATDALVFAAYGLSGELNPYNQHNCDQTRKAWRDTTGQLHGLGYLPCYSHYSQTLGPANWHLSTNDWAGYVATQWQPKKLLVFSAGMRWELEQLPPPLASLANPELPQTKNLPSLGSQWGPRLSMALGNSEAHWPVLRLGYGMYFGRTENATLETALTQTGSLNGDLNLFLRPTDNLNAGGAPPFPYVLSGSPGSVVKPGAVEFASGFHNPEVHQAVAAVEETLPGRIEVTAGTMVSLGRRLPVSLDANLGLPTPQQTITYNVCDQTPTGPVNGTCGALGLGPIKAAQITVPFYASWPSSEATCPYYQPSGTTVDGWLCPDYQQINQFTSKANSTYEAAILRVVRYGRRGLSVRAHYTYAHAMDWNPDESPLAPATLNQESSFSQEYGTSNLDMRHSASAMVIYETPWKLHSLAGALASGWMLSGIGQFHSGLPYTMRTAGSLPEEFTNSGALIMGLGPGMNGSGGDNRVEGVGSDNQIYNIGRNTFRYPSTWKADMRLGKSFNLGAMRQLELLVESFNLFNHQNVTELETTGYSIGSGSPGTPGTPGAFPTLNFLTGLKINPITGLSTAAFGQPLSINGTNFYSERQVQAGLRIRF
jgi:hypothetical protein